ncbi:MAG: glycosyltransferase family 4 protein [Ardenticatenaceae bacterium]|nr:glycosyltransferase family 4 protein [Ardenticatenaceae bacterium]MCB9443905.1 glycosyltransferase family 4 protein [Ardenticatenaceae bacterium]
MNPKKIAFIKEGGFSLINDRVYEMLRREFPDYNIEVFDLLQIARQQNHFVYLNTLHAIKEYGRSLILGKINYKRSFRRTGYIFRQFKALVIKHIQPEKFTFSLQTSSYYDGSVPGLPHFVYTDHTIKANLTYPDFTEFDLHQQYSPVRLLLEPQVYQHASHIFTMSSHVTDTLVRDYGCSPDKVSCVYCGPNVPERPSIHYPPDRYTSGRILFMGFDWPRKGGPQVLDAYRQIAPHFPQASLTIVGSVQQTDLPRVTAVARVPLNEISNYFAQSAIFCMPTRREPFGTAFLDAAYHKLPVISSRLGALPDYITDGVNGYLVHPNDVAGLASALKQLLADPELCRQMGEANYEIVSSRYTWENTGRLIREQIQKQLNL